MAVALNLPRIDYRRRDAAKDLAALRARLSPRGDVVSEAGRQRTLSVFGEALTPEEVVRRICTDVRKSGLEAVLDYTDRLDGVELTSETVRVTREEMHQAHAEADPELLAVVRRVRNRLVAFQTGILHGNATLRMAGKYVLEQRYRPLERVGICVPGGAAAYPSTVLMTVVPAQVAGVPEIAVVMPPTEFGGYNKDLLAVCHQLGVREVYRVGGAQAVAALAYGVEGIERVEKIVGPGNLFVALAKRFVYGEVAIDALAGPSEVVVVADESASPQYVAADLIAQAEHAPGASILITWSEAQLAAVAAAVEDQLEGLSRGEAARESIERFGALTLVCDEAAAIALANEIAPEHLHVMTEDPDRVARAIHNAGAVFLGPHTPVALGDYVAGPSHVLPTGGTARFDSGLSANDFLRSYSVLRFTREGLESVAADARFLAQREGLTAHAASVDLRLQD
jgi:histidinol dehydrogenase